MKTTASFKIEYHQVLDKNGNIIRELPKFAADKSEMLKLYRAMKLLRILDKRILMMHRTGKVGTYPGTLGQEAVGVAAGSCLTEKDILVPYYRSQGEMLQHGIPLHQILQFWGGNEQGSNYKTSLSKHDLPIAISIGTQMLHAAGVATAIKYRKQSGRAVLVGTGDGGTSEGDFYEALNVAGAWNLPLVAYINNNQWAISETNKHQTACQTLAQKSIASGFQGIQVDGNDVIALKETFNNALEKARSGGGPSLIECITYRLCAHTTMDDDSKYSSKEQQEVAWQEEPLIRIKGFLIKSKMLTEAIDIELDKELTDEVEREIDIWQTTPPQPPEAMFDFMYAELPKALKEQRKDVIRRWGSR